jgi:Ca2+/Na+ antiporter
MGTRDTLFNAEIVRKIQTMNIMEQLRQDEIAAEKLKAETERGHNLQMFAIVIFIILFFSVLIFLSRRQTKHKSLKYIGLVGLLIIFEFISFFMHPYIAHITHHEPVWMVLILVAMASLLVPLHHRLEHWVQHKLAQSHVAQPQTERIAPTKTRTKRTRKTIRKLPPGQTT